MKKIMVVIVIVFTFFTQNQSVHAEDSHELTSKTLKVFFNEVIGKQLAENNLAGVTISVVKDSTMVINEAYGYANYEKQLTFETDTMTRIGSITKVFVWQSILKLYSEGKLNIDDPIVKFVPELKIKNPYNQAITIKHLMTHTAGFEDELSTLFVHNDDQRKALLEDTRRVIYKPGSMVAYSNYGAAVGGRIVEKVSGMKLDEYIRKTIFEPLNMSRTTLLEPARDYFDNVSFGHIEYRKRMRAVEDPSVCYAPAGAMSTTSEDMAKFMIMQLNNGIYAGHEIIEPRFLQLMHQTAYTADADRGMPGMTCGMMEWKRNGLNIVWHSGGNETYKSILLLIPEKKVGLFVSYNSRNSEESRNALREAFLNYFFPYKTESITPMEGYIERAQLYEGYYKEGRGTNANSDKFIYLMSRTEKVTANKDGILNFRDKQYLEVEKGVFRQIDGQGRMIFQFDEEGNPIRLFQDYEPHEGYLRMKMYETPDFIGALFITFMFIIIALLVFHSVDKKIRKVHIFENESSSKFFNLAMLITAFYPIIFIVIFGIGMILDPLFLVNTTLLKILHLTLLLPFLASVIMLMGIISFIRGLSVKKYSKIQITFNTLSIFSLFGLYTIYCYLRLFGMYFI